MSDEFTDPLAIDPLFTNRQRVPGLIGPRHWRFSSFRAGRQKSQHLTRSILLGGLLGRALSPSYKLSVPAVLGV
jgi:hypothetical protein